MKLCYYTTDGVLQLPQKSGKKETEVNPTGIGRDRKTRGENQKINGARTLSSSFTLILFYKTQVLKGRKIAHKMLLLLCMWKVGGFSSQKNNVPRAVLGTTTQRLGNEVDLRRLV